MRKKQKETTNPAGLVASPAEVTPAKEKAARKPRAAKKSGAKSEAKSAAKSGARSGVKRAANGIANGTANGLRHLAEAVSPPVPEDRDAVALRAYFRWLERGCPAGSAEQDWLEAEREVQAV